MNEMEHYARGLAMAEGTVVGKSLRYSLGGNTEEERTVLERISDHFKCKNGVRYYTNKGAQLMVSGKGWWKDSLEGIEFSKAAMRGYLEGDGTIVIDKRKGRGNYIRVVLYVRSTETHLSIWIPRWLDRYEHHFGKWVQQQKGRTIPILAYVLHGLNAACFLKELYEDANIGFKGLKALEAIEVARKSHVHVSL